MRTERLGLRCFTADDAAFIVTLLNEPAFFRFIGDRNVRTNADALKYLRNGPIRSYETNGFGPYLVAELGCIVARVDPENAASVGVLERIGMCKEGAMRLPNGELDLLLFVSYGAAVCK
jgi:RimJ/RimL family protein N-acetyltransferase